MNLAMLALHSSPLSTLGTRDAGGMSVVLINLAAALARRGHRLDLFTCRGDVVPGQPVELAPGVRLFRLDAGGAASVAKDRLPNHLPKAAEELQQLVDSRGLTYDLVHSHYWVSGVVGQQLSRMWKVPHLLTFHTLAAAKNRLACGEDEPPRRRVAEQELALRCDRVIAPSVGERETLVECCGVPGGRVAVVPWGVDLKRFRPGDRAIARANLGITTAAKVLLFVGRFAPVKGLDLLLRALPSVAQQHPTVCLLVAGGDGPGGADTRTTMALAEEQGVSDRVRWLGPVPQGELPTYFCATDLVVVPSRYESFGLVPLEALACGTPVVATRVGALEEIVCHGVNGRLATAPTPSALAAAMAEQLTAPPVTAETLRATVEGWDWDRVAERAEAVYVGAKGPIGRGTR